MDGDLRRRRGELFAPVLRREPSRRGTPYSERTVGAYLDAVDSLGRWLDELDHPGGFETHTVRHLNAYLRTYLDRHSIGGVVTKQQNLRRFLRHLVEEYDADDLWGSPKRHRYQRPEHHPDVLDAEIIQALLKVTAGRAFRDRRDHAVIRVLLAGPRREEVARLQVEHLDMTSGIKSAALVGLKGHAGRRIPLGDRDVLALRRWLTVRARHPRLSSADEGPVWVGEKTGVAMTASGMYGMLRRRAVEAGYDRRSIRPHLFRHTFAHEFLAAGGSESDLMALAGWRDRSMVFRYGAYHGRAACARRRQPLGFSDRY